MQVGGEGKRFYDAAVAVEHPNQRGIEDPDIGSNVAMPTSHLRVHIDMETPQLYTM